MNDKVKNYPKTDKFEVIDTIGVPHTYCIGPKHLEYSDSMYLDIEGAEQKGAVCDTCRKINKKTGKPILTYKEHQTALLVKVRSNEPDLNKVEGLREYLLSIKDQCEKDGFAGFVFTK